jgi:hypothetical protein
LAAVSRQNSAWWAFPGTVYTVVVTTFDVVDAVLCCCDTSVAPLREMESNCPTMSATRYVDILGVVWKVTVLTGFDDVAVL